METIWLEEAERRDPDIACQSTFSVGGVSVQVAGKTGSDVALAPPLQMFQVGTLSPDICLRVEWVETLAPLAGRKVFDSGSVWRLYDDDSDFVFDFSSAMVGRQPYKRLTIDTQFRKAILQMNSECVAGDARPVPQLEYPLDELLIMHRLTQEKAIELHGCGIVRFDGIGNLFVGHSGTGKSTTTRLWTACEDVEVLSDDRIIVRRDEDRRCESSAAAGEQQVSCFARNDKTRSNKGKMRMYGTPWHGEEMYASANSAPLARVLILEHGHGNVLTQLSPSQSVGELFARSFVPFHRHEYVESALTFLEELVEAVPVYHYAFEPDQRAVDTILNLRD